MDDSIVFLRKAFTKHNTVIPVKIKKNGIYIIGLKCGMNKISPIKNLLYQNLAKKYINININKHIDHLKTFYIPDDYIPNEYGNEIDD